MVTRIGRGASQRKRVARVHRWLERNGRPLRSDRPRHSEQTNSIVHPHPVGARAYHCHGITKASLSIIQAHVRRTACPSRWTTSQYPTLTNTGLRSYSKRAVCHRSPPGLRLHIQTIAGDSARTHCVSPRSSDRTASSVIGVVNKHRQCGRLGRHNQTQQSRTSCGSVAAACFQNRGPANQTRYARNSPYQ